MMLDMSAMEVFCLDETEIQDPLFKTVKDAQNKIYTKNY